MGRRYPRSRRTRLLIATNTLVHWQTQHLTSEENTAHTQAGNMMLDYGYGVCHAVPGIKDLIFIMGLLQSHGTFRKLCIARQFMSLEICFKESLWDAGLILLHSVSQSPRGEQFP